MLDVFLESIPAELKALSQWVLWRYVNRNGKPTKVPYDAATGAPAKPNDPATWSTYEFARQKWLNRPDAFSGIGFVFREDGGLVGVDLDDCIGDDGDLSPFATEIVEKLATYTEVSPSGKGLKLFCLGNLPIARTGVRNDQLGVEVYQHGRYFTVTGRQWPGTPGALADRQTELLELLNQIRPARQHDVTTTEMSNKTPVVLASDEVILHRAMTAANGQKFRQLYGGDTSAYATPGNGGHSEADLALVGLLAFWTGPDIARIDVLFRSSGLMRPKWDEPHFADGRTYGQATIERALLTTRAYYPWKRQPMCSTPMNYVVEVETSAAPSHVSSFEGQSDLANGIRFASLHGSDVRWCDSLQSWYVWDGTRWSVDRERRVDSLAKCVCKHLREQYKASANEPNMNHAKCLAFIKSTESARGIAAMLNLAKSEPGIPVRPEQLDQQPWLLNVANGTIDLRSCELRPHQRGDYLTQMCPVEFDRTAQCPQWKAFLSSILDAETIAYLQRAIGYSLTGVAQEHVLFILHGVGSNGKSTLINTIVKMMGSDYAMTASPHLLIAKKYDSHPTERADLQLRRFVSCMEAEEGDRLAEALVKSLTGGDPMRARKVCQDNIEFQPTHTIWLTANHKPEIRGTDHGMWRRVKLIEFKTRISDEMQDKDLPEKLKVEWPGILAWAVEGCLAWQHEGLAEPQTVKTATASYRHEMDVIGAFLSEVCMADKAATIKSSELYAAYTTWCAQTKQTPMSLTKFGSNLTTRRLKKRKSNGVRYQGLRLLDSAG
ncbi:MAG: hypothetical protein KF708_14540 [Pirellulales bacterium]|nr:hypothetical protein [Pirellulales bacterium]